MKKVLKYLKRLFSRNKEVETHIFFIPEDSFYGVIKRAVGDAAIRIVDYKSEGGTEVFDIQIEYRRFRVFYYGNESEIKDRLSCNEKTPPLSISFTDFANLLSSAIMLQMKLDSLAVDNEGGNVVKDD